MTKADLFLTQKSLTEWFEDIKHADTETLRREDNEKRERLAVLKNIAGIPYDEQVKFSARDVADNTKEHQQYVRDHGDELCAMRLIPLDHTLPKLRMRGWSVQRVQQWFRDQHIDPEKYRVEYVPHPPTQEWSTIFVVNDDGIFGEIIWGSHGQLTQGFYDSEHRPYTFAYDFHTWQMEPENDEALSHMKEVVAYLQFSEAEQKQAKQALGSTFVNDYLKGYFETMQSEAFGLWFFDYAPQMAAMIGTIQKPIHGDSTVTIKGQVGCAGQASGPVSIVKTGDSADDFPEGAVLVSEMTTPDLVASMQKACAIVTDNGGILSHAAIVARELKKPCIVGTGNATKVLRSGQLVVVDADTGEVHPT